MTGYLQQNNLLPEFESAYCHHHSTESAMLKVFSDIVDALGATSFCSPSLSCQPLSILWTTISCGTWIECLLHLRTSCVEGRKVLCSGRCCSCSTRPTSAASFELTISYSTATRMTRNYTSVHHRKVHV